MGLHYDPEARTLGITTTVHSATLSSHTIPAYPEYDSDTTFDAAYYTQRRATNDKLAGLTITYVT